MPIRPSRAWAGILLVLACSPDSKTTVARLPAGATPPPSSLLRVPAKGGRASLYRLPDLKPWPWESRDTLPPVAQVLGADLASNLVYLASRKGEIVSFDLLTARARRDRFPGGASATLGPDGALYTVNDSLAVTQYLRRTPRRLNGRLAARPRDLFGGRGASVLAVSTGERNELTVFRQGDDPLRAPLPAGDAAATFWGDLLAVAADSAILLVDPRTPGKPEPLRIGGHARAVVFSPSGHRFYVARREGPLQVYNRFTHELLAEVELPRAAGALRMDPYGRWLLVHPAGEDSVWVVNLAANRMAGAFGTEWSGDLPAVTNREVLLLRDRGGLIARDLASPGFPQRGALAATGDDIWLPLEWGVGATGSSDAAPPPDSEAPAPAGPPAGTEGVFLQVSSSQNPEWARQLARQLEQQGLPAHVVDPAEGEEGYRVVLGPFPTREAAESAGRRLGRPFFVYQPDR